MRKRRGLFIFLFLCDIPGKRTGWIPRDISGAVPARGTDTAARLRLFTAVRQQKRKKEEEKVKKAVLPAATEKRW